MKAILTDPLIHSVKLSERRYEIYDQQRKGLSLRVGNTEEPVFYYRFRNIKTNKRARCKLGDTTDLPTMNKVLFKLADKIIELKLLGLHK